MVATFGTRLIFALGCKFTCIVVVAGRLHPEIGASIFGLRWTVRVHGKGENNQRRTGKIGQNANNVCR